MRGRDLDQPLEEIGELSCARAPSAAAPPEALEGDRRERRGPAEDPLPRPGDRPRRPRGREPSLEVELAGLAAHHLAARGARQRPRLDEDDGAGGDAVIAEDPAADPFEDRLE